MVPPPQGTSAKRAHKRERFSWLLAMMVSLGFIAILAFVIVALLILQSQGISQGMNTLTVISIIVGFVISVLSLLISFLQWHHPQSEERSELSLVPLLQVPGSGSLASPPSPSISTDPQRQDVESQANLPPSAVIRSRSIDWGEAPDSEQLYGREEELINLKRWLVDEHCRLVAILGMGGIGKTCLAATLVDQVHEHYDCVFWRSLHNAPPLLSVLQECIPFISAQADTVLPTEVDRQISLLIDSFRTHRCLLVLDNVESILQGGSQAGHYREGYEGYGRLLQRIGGGKHQSCLLITSREKPPEVALLEGEAVATRSLHLDGLKPEDGRDILKGKGLQGNESDWEVLITHYGGNPLALKLVAQVIREVFGRAIELKPGLALAYYNRGSTYQRMGKVQQAIEDFNAALQLKPKWVLPYQNRATTYVFRGDYLRAIQDYNQILALQPRFVASLLGRAVAYGHLKDFQRALEDCEAASQLIPHSIAAYGTRGGVYMLAHDYQRAIADYDKALTCTLSSAPWYANRYTGNFKADVYIGRSLAYTCLRNYQQALQDSNEAIALAPQLADAYSVRGWAYLGLMELQQAHADFARACELFPDSCPFALLLVWTEMCMTGPNTERAEHLLAIAEGNPQHHAASIC